MNPIFPSRYVVVSTQPFYITGPNQIIECNGFAYDPRTTFTTSDLFAGYSYENVGALLSNFQCQEPEAIRRQRQQQQEQELQQDNNSGQGDQDNLDSHRCESPEIPISIDKPFYRRESALFDKKRTRGRPKDEVKARTFYCCMNPNCLIRKDAEKKIVDGKVRYSIRSKNIKNIRRHPCVKNMMIGDGMALADLVNYLIKEGYVKKCVDPPGEYSDNECDNNYINSNSNINTNTNNNSNINNNINDNINNNNINNNNNNINNNNDNIDKSISGSDGAIIIDDDDDDENGDGNANSKGDEQTKSMEDRENGHVDGNAMDVENDTTSHVPDTQGCASSTVSGNTVIVIDKSGNVVENNDNNNENNNENSNVANNSNEVNNNNLNNNNNEKENQQQEKEKEKEKESQDKYQEKTVIKYEIKEGNYCFDFGKDQNFNINSMIFGAINLPSLPMCDLDDDKSDKTRNKTGTKCPPATALPVKLTNN